MEDDPYATVVTVRCQTPAESFISDCRSASSSPTFLLSAPHDFEDEDERSEKSSNTASTRVVFDHNLRPGVRHRNTCFVTWWDADDSGNYDPALEGKQSNGRKIIRSAPYQSTHRKELTSETHPDNKRRIEQSGLASRQRGCAFTLTFPYTALGTKGQALVNDIPDHWPEKYHNTLSEEYIAQQFAEMTEVAQNYPYMLRSRTNSNGSNETSNRKNDDCVNDSAGIEEDLTNHPAARGCVACRRLSMRCPLLDTETAWPCRTCLEDGCDCELIVPPARKSNCEECRRKRVECSYGYEESDPRKPCSHCSSTNTHCIVGPARNAIRQRISYDRDYTALIKTNFSDREYVTCTACRRDRVACSLRKKTNDPPCLECIMRGLDCTFEAVRHEKKRCKSDKKAETNDKDKKAQLLKSHGEIPDNAIYIKTSLCHPISFLHPEQDECHWCSNPSYGILGLGWKDVLVQLAESRYEYYELTGGHCHNGQQTSRICVTCKYTCRVKSKYFQSWPLDLHIIHHTFPIIYGSIY
jgi:hypothetical protein